MQQAQGEQIARSIYPETTIVRPAPLFGFEDNLLLKLASVLNLLTANNMRERFAPVHVGSTCLSAHPDSAVYLTRLVYRRWSCS